MTTQREKNRRKMTRNGISIHPDGNRTHVIMRRHRGGAEQITLDMDCVATAAEIVRALGAVPQDATRNRRIEIVCDILRNDLIANKN